MKLNIAVLPGDGIGPEIISVALDVTKAICDKFKHNLSFEYGICGADAIDKVGNPYLVRIGNMKVKVRFANNGISMEQAFENMLLSV